MRPQVNHLAGVLISGREEVIIRLRGVANPSRTGWHHNGKTRHERGYGTAWDKLRRYILSRDKHLCQPCLGKGRVTSATEVDHITPKAKGGMDDADNLQAICGPCHRDKTLRDAGHKTRQAIGVDGWPC